LREAGFRVVLIASPGDLLDATVAREGIEALPIPMKRGMAPLADLVSLFRLVKALYRLRPDIAEFSTPKAGLLGNLAALLCGVPHRVYLLRGLRLETASGLKRFMLRATEQIAAACSHVVLCNSRSLREKALTLRVASERKLVVLGPGTSNGVDVKRFAPGFEGRSSLTGIPPGTPVIGFVGRLTRDKGLPELMRAFDDLLRSRPEAWLVLVGWFDESEDALPPHLRETIERHPKLLRTGFVADTAPWYRAMDVLVLPTHREGFPNVVLEAAASGIPVITTLVTGSREAVLPGVTGLLVPPGDSQALTESMLELLANPARRQQMGAAARSWVVERFPKARIHALSVALYKELWQGGVERQASAQIKDAAAVVD
jgi:glycosyltransferase involved in cell wall biosynthesis